MTTMRTPRGNAAPPLKQPVPSDISRSSSPLPRPWGLATQEDEREWSSRPVADGILVVAASTGGPPVLIKLLSSLPADFPYAVVIAQHIAEGFAGGLAKWLNRSSGIPVVLAKGGERLVPGVAYLSPTSPNMNVTATRRTELRGGGAEAVYHPSCDCLMHSAAAVFGRRTIGVIMTGMGWDGASGIEAVAKAGGITIAQDEASSVVFGMNGAAVKRGCVRHVVPGDRIAAMVMRAVQETRAAAVAR